MLSLLPLLVFASEAPTDPLNSLASSVPAGGGGLESEDGGFEDGSFEDDPFGGVSVPDFKILASDTPEQASEKLNRQHASLKTAVEGLSKGVSQIDPKLVKEMGENIRSLQEKLAAQQAPAQQTGPEGELRFFIEEKSIGGKMQPTLRWVGSEDSDGIFRSGFLDDDGPVCGAWHERARELFETRSLARACIRSNDPHNVAGAGRTPKLDRLIEEHLQRAPEPLKRIFSGSTGAGSEWQQVTVLPMIATELRKPLQVEALFDVIDLPTKSVQMPFDAGVARPYRKGTPTTNAPANYAASDSNTTSRTLTSDSLAVQVLLFDDADEDSVIATRAFLARKVVDGLRYGFEDCIINGDTGTHQDTLSGWNPRSIYNTGDSAFGGADDHRRSFIGLRAAAFDASASRDASSDSAFSTGTLLSARLGLDAPHGTDGDLVYLTSLEHYLLKILGDSNTLTMEKMGPMAAILTGQVASVLGVRIVVSEFLTGDLAASGLRTGSGSKTGAVLFNRKRFVVGNRRGAMLEAAKDIRNGVHYLVATRRGTFKAVDASTHKAVHYSYNLATS